MDLEEKTQILLKITENIETVVKSCNRFSRLLLKIETDIDQAESKMNLYQPRNKRTDLVSHCDPKDWPVILPKTDDYVKVSLQNLLKQAHSDFCDVLQECVEPYPTRNLEESHATFNDIAGPMGSHYESIEKSQTEPEDKLQKKPFIDYSAKSSLESTRQKTNNTIKVNYGAQYKLIENAATSRETLLDDEESGKIDNSASANSFQPGMATMPSDTREDSREKTENISIISSNEGSLQENVEKSSYVSKPVAVSEIHKKHSKVLTLTHKIKILQHMAPFLNDYFVEPTTLKEAESSMAQAKMNKTLDVEFLEPVLAAANFPSELITCSSISKVTSVNEIRGELLTAVNDMVSSKGNKNSLNISSADEDLSRIKRSKNIKRLTFN